MEAGLRAGDTLEEAVEAMRPYPDGPTLPPHYRFTAHTNNARSCHGVTKGEWQREKKQLERDDGSKVSKLLKRSACWLGSNEPRHELYRQGRYQQAIDLFVHVRRPALYYTLAHGRWHTCGQQQQQQQGVMQRLTCGWVGGDAGGAFSLAGLAGVHRQPGEFVRRGSG
jgi:hypothetical protein